MYRDTMYQTSMRLSDRLLPVLLVVVLSAAAVRAGSQAIVCVPACDGSDYCFIVTGSDPTGPQRAAIAHLVTTANGGIQPIGVYVEVDGTRVDLSPDTVVSAFYQTHPAFRARLGPADTWIGFSARDLVPMDGFVDLTYAFKHLALSDAVLSETREVHFSLTPWTYADTDDIADSVLSTSIGARIRGAGLDRPYVETNVLIPIVNGRYVSDASTIPSDPAGGDPGDSVYLPRPGDLVVTEIMRNPNGSVADASGEWFEVTNVSDVRISLEGVDVRDDDGEFFKSWNVLTEREAPLVLDPGGIAVIGRSRDTRLNGAARVDRAVGPAFTLADATDEIVLEVPGMGEIDRVAYDASWPDSAGRSLELSDTAADNDDSANWTVATRTYGNQGQRGTPGKPYDVPAETPPIGDPGVAAETGSLVVTEIHTQPKDEDERGEYVEVFNPLDTPVVLTDLTVEIASDTGAVSSFRITTATILDPGGYLLLSRLSDAAVGGIPSDYDYPDAFALYNDSATLTIRNDSGSVVDRISWNGSLFPGFPDFGDGVDGAWPMPSEYDGRTIALRGTSAQLRDTAGYDNDDASNWAPSEGWRLNRFGVRLIGTPGAPNLDEATVSLSMPDSANARDFTETFAVTITPTGGYGVSDVDTQSIRLFWVQRPVFLQIGASTIRADFRSSAIPGHVERNVTDTAHLTARYLGDTPLRFGGAAPFTARDTTLPTPGSITTPAPGDLVITEIMVNPEGDEDAREYFELYNATADSTFDLRDLGVMDGGGGTSDSAPESRSRIYNKAGFLPIRLGPGRHAVVGRNEQPRILGGYFPQGTYMNQDLNFANGGDQVVVFRLSDGVAVAEVDFESSTAGFPSQSSTTIEGRSLSLIDTGLDPALGGNWVNAGIPFGDSGHGTPGGPNRIVAHTGDLLVTEIYPDPPPGTEPNAEFFEVTNPGADTVDLSGLEVRDDNGNTFALTDKPGLIVSGGAQRLYARGGEAFVLGNSRGTAGGVDTTFYDTFGAGVTGYDYPNAWTLVNSGDAVRLVRRLAGGDTVVVHGTSYSSSSTGKSWALESMSDTTTYVLREPDPTVGPPE